MATLGASVVHAGCGDDPAPSGSESPAADASLDAEASDASAPDAPLAEGGAAADAETSLDAGQADSDAADAMSGSTYLYAHLSVFTSPGDAGPGTLVRVDPATGLVTTIGTSGQHDVRMVWDPAASTMRAIVDALTAPRLATVDLCTGTITAGPRITRRSDAGGDGGALTHAECIARHSSGTLFGGADWNGDPLNVPLSESLVSYDLGDNTATRLGGPLQTDQEDCDSMTVIGDDIYVLDIASTTSGLYRVNGADAATSRIGDLPNTVTRIGYDTSRAALYAVDSANRRLWQVQPGDAGLILSADLVTDAGSAKFFDSLVAAPAPICP